ncbi:hypothetical protein B0I35DRAFT_478094 [Stachybotrys elegans]|uniref:F-box domain-containing protein n=1 Tax=Stachybotrys elegans TaxID=80388 RepID=A0A8K0WSE6_9HYPO|nr:hypothetical protein B0I35DRAFT_478094 [Stachybotrys elegans]
MGDNPTTNPFDRLPDEILLDVVEQLDAARDVASLGTASRHTHQLMSQEGWKAFVKTRFPSHRTPASERTSWSRTADRLTYLDRCWEKRAVTWRVFEPQYPPRGRRLPAHQPRQQSTPFLPVLDAALLPSSDGEIVACGAGENLVLRWRRENETSDLWHQLDGHAHGFSPGTGDVTALSVLQRNGQPEVAVGRANGDLQIISTEEGKLGHKIQSLALDDANTAPNGSPFPGTSASKLAISWTDWQPQTSMLASCQSSKMLLYSLSNAEEKTLTPAAMWDFQEGESGGDPPFLRSSKFLSRDTLACALGANLQPLRWLKVLPTGIELLHNVSGADGVEAGFSRRLEKKTTVRAIETVAMGSSEALLLSAWEDGSYRLIDHRTPSAADVVYRDRFQPYASASSLLVYGGERFVAGSNWYSEIVFFDFRYPKPYHHVNGMPCSGDLPTPPTGVKDTAPAASTSGIDRCDWQRGQTCTWHGASRSDKWRPDATVRFRNRGTDLRVFALAKASDVSKTFYCGFKGFLGEVELVLAEDRDREHRHQTMPPGWSSRPVTVAALQETGVSRCEPLEADEEYQVDGEGSWTMWSQRTLEERPQEAAARSRLDSCWSEIQR